MGKVKNWAMDNENFLSNQSQIRSSNCESAMLLVKVQISF